MINTAHNEGLAMKSQPQVAAEKSPKKRYRKPKLTVYGQIGVLTLTVGMGSVSDGMAGKTH
jgi:hypothetical protein